MNKFLVDVQRTTLKKGKNGDSWNHQHIVHPNTVLRLRV